MRIRDMDVEFKFSERLIADGYVYAFGICAADIDGDGHLDIVSADAHVGLYWYANDGEGNFTRHVIQYCPRTRLERMACADLTGNGYPDIVIVDNIHGDLLLFENQGSPRDGRPWPCQYLAGPETDISLEPLPGALPHAYDVAIVDLTGNGHLDVAATSWYGNAVAWFENTGSAWVKHTIEEDIEGTRTIRAADFNGNGRSDLLVTAANAGQVIWYENPGDPINQPWRKYVIADELRPTHGHPMDMTGNGAMDVVMACGFYDKTEAFTRHQIVWYENTGSPDRTPWPRHVIASNLPHAFEAVAGDLDGDGQPEVVASGSAGTLAVFKHQGDPRGLWAKQVLRDNWTKATQVILADLDSDGLPDIIACAERGSNEVRWWRNEN
jgi:hypothetical protein